MNTAIENILFAIGSWENDDTTTEELIQILEKEIKEIKE